MKLKKILIVSLAINVVLLSALAYIQSIDAKAGEIPPIIYLINRADPASISAAIDAAAIPGTE